MKEFWKKIISKTMIPEKEIPEDGIVSEFRMAKAFRRFRISFLRILKDVLLMILGVASAAFGLESFLLPNNFIDGGVIGIALLTSGLLDIPLSWLITVSYTHLR